MQIQKLKEKLIMRLKAYRRKLRDGFQGINIKKQNIVLSSAYFDEEDYKSRYPEIFDFPAGACAHFFLHGLSEGKNARFFDARWYLKTHPDVKISNYDSYGHYKSSISSERRSARFLRIGAEITKGVNYNYLQWIDKYDSPQSQKHKEIKENCANNETASLVSVICKIPNDYNEVRLKNFIVSLKSSYYKNFELIIAVNKEISSEVSSLLEKSSCSFPFSKFDYDSSDSEFAVYKSALSYCNSERILKTEYYSILSPLIIYYGSIAKLKSQNWLCYFDNDYYDENNVRKNYIFKPDFNYDLFLSYNYLGNTWSIDKQTFCSILEESNSGFDFDYSAILGFLKKYQKQNIYHIPVIGFHCAIDKQPKNAPMAVMEYLKFINVNAVVKENSEAYNTNRIYYKLGSKLPKVSIIIPTRDKVDLLKNCVLSILNKSTYQNYEIIIVDNGSQYPETIDFFNEMIKLDNVKVISYDIEFNYSKLNNFAAEASIGEYLCLMNNDIEIISAGWIEELLGHSEQSDVGCVGPRLWYPDDTIQHAGVFVGYYGVAGHWHRFNKRGEESYMNRASIQQTVSALTGAVLFVKKTIFDEVGGLDERLAVAFNDIDFCLKVRNRGYRNIYTPYAQMYHYESASRGKDVTYEQKQRELSEIEFMKNKYGNQLIECPQYNPNLSLESEDFELAFPPREYDLS